MAIKHIGVHEKKRGEKRKMTISKKKTKAATTAFILVLTIVCAVFAHVGFAQEPLSFDNPVPAYKGYQGQYSGPFPAPSPWFGMSDGMPRYNSSCGSYNPTSTAPNSSHILWIRQVSAGGVATTAPDTQYGWGGPNSFMGDAYAGCVAFGGYLFYGTTDTGAFGSGGSVLTCLDERTGEVVWEKRLVDPFSHIPITMSFLWPSMEIISPPSEMGGALPLLTVYATSFGPLVNNFYRISPYTGDIVGVFTFPQQTMTFYSSPKFAAMGFAEGVVYTVSSDGYAYCYAVSSLGTQLGLPPIKIWGPVQIAGGAGAGLTTLYNDILTAASLESGILMGIDAITGHILWTTTITGLSEMHTAGYGKYYVGGGDGKFYAFNLQTGALAWRNDNITGSYWSEFSNCLGDGVIVGTNTDGRIYAFDASTGELLWTFFTGVCPYEPYKSDYGTWPFHQAAIGADGKIYVCPGDDLPRQNVPGQYLYGVDMHTGDLLWKYPTCTMGHTDQGAIADGLLFYPDLYTNQLHCFGKGLSAVEVTVSQSQIVGGPNGYIWINGRVTDQSPVNRALHVCPRNQWTHGWLIFMQGTLCLLMIR